MTLVGATPRTLFFTDRPKRMAGYLSFDEVMDEVSAGPDSFADDPPNATLVSLQGDEFVDVVLVLTEAPTLEGDNLAFSVQVTQGTPPTSSGPAALFIDTVGRPLSPVSVAGGHRRHRLLGRHPPNHGETGSGRPIQPAIGASPHVGPPDKQ